MSATFLATLRAGVHVYTENKPIYLIGVNTCRGRGLSVPFLSLECDVPPTLSLRESIAKRRLQREFVARGLAARNEAHRTGEYFDADDMHAELANLLQAARMAGKYVDVPRPLHRRRPSCLLRLYSYPLDPI
jgi:hypothetical protein